ncbi:anthranilate 1,2-dioxygenase small subunit AndAd [Methylophilus sp. DW102]|uniref:anthranilate 1,2-dioxygenase small subunit AndAd n=1 Tax=Methylophilus sp. DW102 TaxID=3095607 RepID=UPI00308E18F3|nr:aromatic-ring-hydroxylating dioxygenase subunit beta [Methylophilus sp. DW102]
MQELQTWFEVQQLQQAYIAALDNDQLERWPQFFTEDCHYSIVPKENFDAGLPIGMIYFDNRNMLEDRVTSLRHANIFESHTYRHMTSGLVLQSSSADEVQAESSYVVVQTLQNGESHVYQTGRYIDQIVRTDQGWRFKRRQVVYDTSRVQTLLATPI